MAEKRKWIEIVSAANARVERKTICIEEFEGKLFNYTLSDERRWRNYLKENHEKYIWKSHENSFESSFICSKV